MAYHSLNRSNEPSRMIFIALILVLLANSVAAQTCLNSCSNHGQCLNQQVCLCDIDRLGEDCSLVSQFSFDLSDSLAFSWSVRQGTMYGRLRSMNQSSNWVGLIFRSTDGMANGWAWQFSSNSRYASTASEWKSSGRSRPDDKLTNYITGVTSFNDGQTYDVSFNRVCVPKTQSIDQPINHTNDKTDKSEKDGPVSLPTTAGNEMLMSWAFGRSSTWSYHGDNRGRLTVDLATGDHHSVDEAGVSYYVPFIVMGCSIVVFGLAIRLLGQFVDVTHFTQQRLPSLIHQSKAYNDAINEPNLAENPSDSVYIETSVNKPSINQSILRTLDHWTINISSTLNSMTFDSVFVCLLYVVVSLAWVIDQSTHQKINVHLAFGHLTALHLVLIMLPVTRRSLWLSLFGLSFERALVYHRALARMCLIVCTVHLILVSKLLGRSVIFSSQATLHGDGAVFGTLAWLSMCCLILTAYQSIRQKLFECFYYLHLPLAVMCMTFAMVHSTYVRYYMIAPLIIYFVDRVMRRYHTCNFETVEVRIVGDKPTRIVELTLSNNQTINKQSIYQSEHGQYAFIRCSSVSLLQWHPFSITRTINQPNNQSITFDILENRQGSFTHQLIEMINQSSDQSIEPSIKQSIRLPISVDGPYGNLSINLSNNQYRTLILIAGGVGVTAMASVLNACLSKNQSINQSINRIVFIWTARSNTVLTDLLPELSDQLINQSIKDKRVKLLLFNSGRSSPNKQSVDQSNKPIILSGRPDLHAIFSQVARDHHQTNNQPVNQSINQTNVAVLACGPVGMIDDAQSMANQFGYHFHREVFQF